MTYVIYLTLGEEKQVIQPAEEVISNCLKWLGQETRLFGCLIYTTQIVLEVRPGAIIMIHPDRSIYSQLRT